jgi:Flp pilus assembly protein TadD
MRVNRNAEALAVLDRAILGAPHAAKLHVTRGNALMSLQRIEGALASFDRALGVEPGNADAHCGRTIALIVLGRRHEALEAYDRAVALDPNAPQLAHLSREDLVQGLAER